MKLYEIQWTSVESGCAQEAKNAISHRARSLNLLRAWLTENAETFAQEAV